VWYQPKTLGRDNQKVKSREDRAEKNSWCVMVVDWQRKTTSVVW